MSSGFIGIGTKISWDVQSSPEFNGDQGSYTPPAGLTNNGLGFTNTVDGGDHGTLITQSRTASGLAQEAEEVDITNFDSPNFTREFIAGLIDAGQVDLEVIYGNPASGNTYEQLQSILRENKFWRIELPEKVGDASNHGAYIDFVGYVQSVSLDDTVDDAITVSASIRIGGAITFTVPSNNP